MRKIPETAIEIQKGLWADLITLNVKDRVLSKYDLYASEGYCFYIREDEINAEYERGYYQFMYSAYSSIEQINQNIISVPIKEGYEIA